MRTLQALQFFIFPVLFIAQRWLSARQSAPYMDELFHIPQAQAFCSAFRRFRLPSYDPAITTPPALYLPFALLHTLSYGLIPCEPLALRLYSAMAAWLALPLLVSLLNMLPARACIPLSDTHIHSSRRQRTALTTLVALALWLHPVALFYAHLYYTDTQTLLLILLAWYLALQHRHKLSALAALFAALTRQTAMIWHFYIAVDSCLHFVLQSLRKRRSPLLIRSIIQSMRALWPHVTCGCLYAAFLLLNGGVALGDKAHHSPTLHWVMLPYFFGFHALSFLPLQLCAPMRLTRQLQLLTQPRMLVLGGLMAACMVALVCATGPYAHPFVLADNRHYTFYVYRRWLLRSSWRRLSLVPIYMWGVLGPFLELRLMAKELVFSRRDGADARVVSKGISEIFVEHVRDALMVVCAALSVVPSGLLEPRYFVVASTLFSLQRVRRQVGGFTMIGLIGVVVVLGVVNFGLLYIFVEVPFKREVDAHMPNDLSLGRLMF